MPFKKKEYNSDDLLEEPQDDYTTDELEEMEQARENPQITKRGRPMLRASRKEPELDDELDEIEAKPKTPPRKKEIIRYEAVHQAEITGIRDNENGNVLMDIQVLTSILNKLDDIDKKL